MKWLFSFYPLTLKTKKRGDDEFQSPKFPAKVSIAIIVFVGAEFYLLAGHKG